MGGKTPGSMPSDSTEIYEEGLIIPPVKIISEGKVQRDIFDLILNNVRTKREREGDIKAQISANKIGVQRFKEIYRKYNNFVGYLEEILNYSEKIVRKELKKCQTV